jgi:hypothetical protein
MLNMLGKGTASPWCARRDHFGLGWSGGCLAGFRQVVQRAALAASHLQGPKSLTTQLDHLLSLVVTSKHTEGPTRASDLVLVWSGFGTDRPDGVEVPELGVEHGGHFVLGPR